MKFGRKKHNILFYHDTGLYYGSTPLGDAYHGMMANKIIDALYKFSMNKKVIEI